MAKQILDFSNFKKTAEDDNSATLTHKDGHKIHLVKGILSKDLKGHLAKLPLHQAEPEGEVPTPEQESVPEGAGAAAGTAAGIGQSVDPGGEVLGPTSTPEEIQDSKNISMDPNKAAALAENATNLEAEAEAGQAKRNVGIYDQAALDETNATKRLTDIQSNSSKEIAGALQDMKNGFIKPNDYLEHMGAGKKIGTAIGLILGGVGGARNGGQNPALNFLNSQIERNLAAQQANQGTRRNLLSALQDKYHDNVQAANMFRVINAAKHADEINSSAAQAGTLISQARALAANSANQVKFMPLKRMTDAYEFFQQPDLSPASKLRVGQMAGIITPQQYSEGNKELDIAEKTKAAHEAVDEIIPAIKEQQTAGNRIFNPVQSKQTIDALNSRLVPLMLQISPSKRLTSESIKREVAPYLPGFFTGKTTAEGFKRDLHRTIDTLADKPSTLQGLGISPPRYVPPIETKTVGGVKYMKGPKGEAIPVK